MITASIIDDILIIQESHIIDIKEDADDTYGGDVIEAIFQDSLHLSSGLIVEERVKAFVDKLFNQVHAFC